MITAVVFPGQGAQYVGMGQAFFRENENAQMVLQACSKGADLDLAKLISEGPEEVLTRTEFTQPAILAVSMAIYNTLDITPQYLAGFSLGQYSALAASGVFSLAQAARLLRLRGRFMQEAASEGKMAAILGLDEETVNTVLASVDDYVVAANLNCPGQIVISGTEKGVAKAIELAKEKGARRAVLLNVSGAFHSALMQAAVDELEREIKKETLGRMEIPVIGNESAREISDVKSSLLQQLVSPVRWQETIEYLKGQGVQRFIEVGPGKVLSGLIKKIDKSLEIVNIEEPQDLEKLR